MGDRLMHLVWEGLVVGGRGGLVLVAADGDVSVSPGRELFEAMLAGWRASSSAAVEWAADRWAGADRAAVRGVHGVLAVAVELGAGGIVAGLGRVGALDDPRLSGRAWVVPRLCLRSALWLGRRV